MLKLESFIFVASRLHTHIDHFHFHFHFLRNTPTPRRNLTKKEVWDSRMNKVYCRRRMKFRNSEHVNLLKMYLKISDYASQFIQSGLRDYLKKPRFQEIRFHMRNKGIFRFYSYSHVRFCFLGGEESRRNGGLKEPV